jgi:nitrite reductase/ring-hydroxylating ferredoxin subunit
VPPAPPIPLTTYERVLPVSVERIWENVLDWEHLPGLHRHEFASVRLIESGDWGWRAAVRRTRAESRVMTVEVVLDRERLRYVTATVEGPGRGTEIRTRLTPAGKSGARETHVHVEFLVPDVPPDRTSEWAAGYRRLYARLWDEDEAMMLRRERLLSRAPSETSATRTRLELGSIDEVRTQLPLVVEIGNRAWRIVSLDGEMVVHSTICPHQLGPLEDAPIENGTVECPWHRYRFDLRTGRSCDGRNLRLAPAPRIAIDENARVALVLDVSERPG